MNTSLENLVCRYNENATLKALVQLVPFSVGSALDSFAVTKLNNVRAKRTRIFFDGLASGKAKLTQSLIENDDFLHCFFATTEAALRTHREEKITFLANLLVSAAEPEKIAHIDEYEELLSIINELSYRELSILKVLDKYEMQNPKLEDENDLIRTEKFWDKFNSEVTQTLNILPNEIDSILLRLNRSGCYETFTGTYMDYTGGKGKTTHLYQRIKALALT